MRVTKLGAGAVGRPPIGRKAMSPAARQKRYRLRKQRLATGSEKRQRRATREAAMAARTAAAADWLASAASAYGVLLADPAWRFEPRSRLTGMDRSADNHYGTMSTAEIAALRPPATPDCALFLWATAPMLLDALMIMAAWGFAYRSHIVWVKDRIGTGYWNRNKHELLLIGTRGDVLAPLAGTQCASVIEAPRGRHSEKPAVFRDLIAGWFPNVAKLELFARIAAPGWDAWGNEAPDMEHHNRQSGRNAR
jgi:N6-adenosine-specific RNA methylase IME4